MSKWYAVAAGKIPGIYREWNIAKEQVLGYSGARYQSFSTEQAAREYLNLNDMKAQSKNAVEPSTIAYTDGSGEGGKFGFGGVILESNGKTWSFSEPLPLMVDQTRLSGTNNQAELYAILFALKATKGRLKIYTDSQYAIGCLSPGGWSVKWQKKNWVGVKNVQLIQQCLQAMKDREVTFSHVKAHNGDKYNEMADQAAKQGAARYSHS